MSLSEDRSAILDLIYRYAELIDAGEFDAVGALLGRARFGGARTAKVSGAEAIAGIFAMTTRRFADGTPRTRHLVLNPIVEIDGDLATARSTFCVVQATGNLPLQPIVVGRYYDQFARDRFARDPSARDEGDWYFTERISDVEMLGDTSEHLLIDPAAFDEGSPDSP